MDVPPAWPLHLQDALNGALAIAEGHTQQTIERALAEGKTQLWDGPHSFCLTELRVSPNGQRSVHLFLAGADVGYLAELHRILPFIEDWARANKATKVTMLGRHGWARTFLTAEEGYQPTLTFYEKELV